MKTTIRDDMTSVIGEEDAKTLLKGISIPPQPQIMVDLQMELAMPDPGMDEIAKIILKDAAISGSILKVVNSPFFGLRHTVTSIQQALNMLGTANVANIVNSLSIRESLSDEEVVGLTKFWDSAMDTANVCAAIAKTIGISQQDEAYAIGLFHNSGIPLMMMRFKNYSEVLEQAYADETRRITDVENEMLGTNHAVVGYYVAKAWKLAPHISQAIADHHKTGPIFRDEIRCDENEKNLLAILKLADDICGIQNTLGSSEVNYEFERIKSDLLIYLDMSDYDLEGLHQEINYMGLG